MDIAEGQLDVQVNHHVDGIEAASWEGLLRYWWQYVLIGFILVSIGLGVTFLLYLLICRLCNEYLRRNAVSKQLPPAIKRYLSQSSIDLSPYGVQKTTEKPTSYGVYLGVFETPPTSEQVRILAEWDLLIFDPAQGGVLEAMSSGIYPISPQTVARLDVGHISRGSKLPVTSMVQWISKSIKLSAKITGYHHCFTGILIGNWEESITVPILRAFILFASSLGFTVYLEASAPRFLIDPMLAELEEVTGVVVRNGTISANGEERDAFQMAQMRPTIKAFVSQACLRSFVVLLWETLEDDAKPLNAVTRRSYQWTRFYSALSWIGTRSALTSAEMSVIQQEPLGAFDWLKELRVMKIHERWRFNRIISQNYVRDNSEHLEELHNVLATQSEARNHFTDLQQGSETSTATSTLSDQDWEVLDRQSLSTVKSKSNSLSSASHRPVTLGSPTWRSLLDHNPGNPLSISSNGLSYDYFGCFPLGLNITRKAFSDTVQAQQRLRDMLLLDQLQNAQLRQIGLNLQDFCNTSISRGIRPSLEWFAVLQELAHQLADLSETCEDDFLNRVRVYIGLDSGFQIQPGVRFWGVYGLNEHGNLDIFLSRNVNDIAGAIIHTFLSSCGCPRHECFQTELLFAEWSKTLHETLRLSPRMVDDLEFLSPTEVLKFMQHLSLTPADSRSTLISLLRDACENQLLDATDFGQLKALSTSSYLSRQSSAADLVNARLDWYEQLGCQYPNPSVALQNFLQIDTSITMMLKHRNISSLQRLTDGLSKCIESETIDSRVDMVAFAVFCAMRKHAFDEAYIEVTDRNTLFNDQSDQAAAFAELFATGARCEAYFDMTPSAFGKLLSDRYRAYHHRPGYEPPLWTDAEPATPSAYAAAKIDVDPNTQGSSLSTTQKFTFLSVFAIPALLDIILLTTTGHGLYLSSGLSKTHLYAATLGLMLSLLISGAVGTWISCGGSYYLISMAYSAMNMFVVTRLVGGFAFTLVIAAIGLVIFGVLDSFATGIIFFLYLIALTTYLTLLAALANFQYPSSAFQSGRSVLISVIPFLFISPVTTIWLGDKYKHLFIYVYLTVLYAFMILLVLGVRHTGTKWTTWYLGIEKVSDQELRKWYIKNHKDDDEDAVRGMTEPGVLKLARDAMLREVTALRKQFRLKCNDAVVLSLAKSYDATMFLLEWYSNYSGTPLPIPYSSTWNMQTKVALQTLKQLQTGIRLHNAFIHWRQAGDEVGCSILYFVVALLDKWNALLAGGELLGFTSTDKAHRSPVGFALAYYLIGAVLLDLNAAKLHTATVRGQNMLIGDVSSIPEAVKREVRARSYLYWTMLGRYLLFHVWSMAIACTLIWVFDSTKQATPLFFSYIFAYTGLLWYQYTKIFSGPRSLKPLIIAVVIGLPLGQLLRHFLPRFIYPDVAALGAATWTAAFLTLYYARIRSKPAYKSEQDVSSPDSSGHKDIGGAVYHAFTNPGKDPLLSQEELKIVFYNLKALRDEERYQVDPQTHPGLEVKSVLLHALGNCRTPRGSLSNFALEAFPEASELLETAVFAFENGSVIVDCIPMLAMTEAFQDVKAIVQHHQGTLRIVIGCEMMSVQEQQSSISNFCQATAEIIVHAVAESFVGMTHEFATIAESLLVPVPIFHIVRHSPVPSRVKNYLTTSNCSTSRARALARFSEDQTIHFLALGFDPDLEWERLPRDIRELIIKRCVGQEDYLTRSQHEWLVFNKSHGMPVWVFLARCNFGAYVAMSNRRYALGSRNDTTGDQFYHQDTLASLNFLRITPPLARFTPEKVLKAVKTPFSKIYHNLGVYLKLLAIAFVAEPEFQRELDYAIHGNPKLIRSITFFLATCIWEYTRAIQSFVMPIFLLHNRKNITTMWSRIGGTTIALKRHRIVIENSDGISTAFIHTKDHENGSFDVRQYSSDLDKEPEDNGKLQRVSTYSKDMLLLRREDYFNWVKTNVYEYEYHTEPGSRKQKRLSKLQNHRYPISRRCTEGKDKCEEVNFNYRGLVQSGSYILHGSLIRFSCHYRQGSNFDDELLRAEFVLPHMTCTVSWSAPPSTHPEKLDKWIPHSQVMEATFVLESDVYESHWRYDHKFHPTITTTLNGEPIETPPIIQWDHLGVLKKPTKYSFHHDDPLITFRSIKSHAIPRWLGLNTHQNPISTSRARSRLWTAWKNVPGFDGVIVRWLDERLLRREPLLRPYWRRRDRGDLSGAEAFLNENADSVMAAVDLDNSISGWAPLAMKIADLYSFGQGGDANSRSRSKDPDFDDDGLQVLAVDSGTWPNEGGGVSACRRDMINNLRSVNWHMIAESANDSGLPKHQTEMNVRSLKVIPLWGLDFLTPTHGLFRDKLDTEVEHVPRDATKADVRRNFLPILRALVKGARTSNTTPADILQTTRALVNLNTYFSDSKHWKAIWTSRTVKDAWRELWISRDLVSPTPSETWFQTEIPTVGQLDGALELWFRYLFIFSIPVPDRVPAIFQASHHSVSASYGIVCKIKRGCTLQIWDHAISWRETNLYLSSDLCTMAPFVRNSLLGLMRITSQLILHHADTILPCADFFNPGWEVEIGTARGTLSHRNKFKRKIDPVVNGIPDMSKFAPIKEITSEIPTVTMLSHVWYAKDIKTAILSADIIVNEWGFTDYNLDIYGAIDKAPSYSTDCFELIASKSLPRWVVMRGEANPTTVLGKTWVFLNSSISEGLPLALGEAALTGAPVVCTDVGASLRVLTDQKTGACYSSIVAPNDARNLARAQINFLAMLEEWAEYAEDELGFVAPRIEDKMTKEQVGIITKRMYEKKEQRRKLGMRSREIVQKAFGGERYLREHEQMLWIGKARYDLLHRPPPSMRLALPLTTPSHLSQLSTSHIMSTDEKGRVMVWPKPAPTSSVQTRDSMQSPSEKSTLMTPGVRSLFEVGSRNSGRGSSMGTSLLGINQHQHPHSHPHLSKGGKAIPHHLHPSSHPHQLQRPNIHPHQLQSHPLEPPRPPFATSTRTKSGLSALSREVHAPLDRNSHSSTDLTLPKASPLPQSQRIQLLKRDSYFSERTSSFRSERTLHNNADQSGKRKREKVESGRSSTSFRAVMTARENDAMSWGGAGLGLGYEDYGEGSDLGMRRGDESDGVKGYGERDGEDTFLRDVERALRGV